MSNEKLVLQNNTDDASTLKLEKMRYNNNSLSYKLGLLGIVCSLIAMFFGLNSVNPTGFGTVLAILMNILIFLLGFLCCEKVKVYQKKYSYSMLGLSVVCFARIFWYPITLFREYSKFTKLLDGTKAGYDAAVSACPKLGASIKGNFVLNEGSLTEGYRQATGYFTGNANVRAVVIIVALAAACALFAASALINIKKSSDLTKHLNQVGSNK